jgi:hypothetical protein
MCTKRAALLIGGARSRRAGMPQARRADALRVLREGRQFGRPRVTEAVTELLGSTRTTSTYAQRRSASGHKHFRAKMPADGGRPQLSPQVSRARSAALPVRTTLRPVSDPPPRDAGDRTCDLCNE